MRHRLKGRRLGRTSEHRKALGKNLLTSLVRHHRIVTTLAKAKEYRPKAEKLVTLAKEKNLANIRRALQVITDKSMVKHLFDVVGPHFKDRPGGYTRIMRLPKNRLGDDGPQAIIEFVDLPRPEAEDEDTTAAAKPAAEKAARPTKAAKPAKPAKKSKAGAK
jgi:large subunit ribosomal protein L17